MMNKLIITLLMSIALVSLNATNTFWSKAKPEDTESLKAKIKASNASYYSLDFNLINSFLNLNENELKELEIPFPNGEKVVFEITKNTSMAEGLQNKFPNIKTFNVSNKALNMTGKVDITHKGFHAMIRTTKGSMFIDPYALNSNEIHISYWKKDFDQQDKSFSCDVEEQIGDDVLEKGSALENGAHLRTYKIAVSSTGEYTQYHGGTVADGLAAIVTSVNRINEVYEKDLSVTLTLIANNDLIVYSNPSTDPFSTPNSAFTSFVQNHDNITAVIGSNNFDIGHLVGTSGSGLAGFAVICKDGSKGRGITGISNPIGDPFDIDYMAHEIGHQFGASHTFNGNDGSCFSNISNSNAYEPGSGTTIMAYAGICNSSNTQNFSDDYFHTNSISQVVFYTTQGSGNSCPITTSSNNNIPVIESLTNTGFSIPKSTPFELEASATDADGDLVSYCWEQFDLGPQGAPNIPSGNAPLFRSFSPKETGIRVFPQISDILNQVQTKGEILADYEREMDFRITVRDNNGATDYSSMTVFVKNSSGPFEVLSQNTNGIVWLEGTQETITWDPAGSTNFPVNCAAVDILLSLDGGLSFPIILKENFPNASGTANITVPEYYSSSARIKVKANNNIFFNINEKNISINPSCAGVVPTNISISRNLLVLSSDFTGTHEWYKNDVLITGETSQTLTVNSVGIYSCIAKDGNCISLLSNKIEITNEMLTVGILNLNEINVLVYPNPSKGVLNIVFDNINENTSLKLIDVIGKTVLQQSHLNKRNVFDLKSFSKGIYHLLITNEKGSYSQKIVVN